MDPEDYLRVDATYTEIVSPSCWEQLRQRYDLGEFEPQRNVETFSFPQLVGDRLCKLRASGYYGLDRNWDNPEAIAERPAFEYWGGEGRPS
ncbi:MAG TPA: hypothetical protein VF210_11275 [Pseudomonadales bacterium]